jgi:ubiquinone/menaquinone biosynthesis C-methylase UbiE
MIERTLKVEAIPSFVAWVYALIARKSPFMRDMHQRIADEICAKISLGRILDIGTGPGYVLFKIAKSAPGLEIYGIDLSQGMVELARKATRRLGLIGRVRFEVANAGALPFPDGHFDLVMSTFSLHHWSEPERYFQEIYRVLKNNGRVYIYEFQKDIPQDVKKEIREKYGWFLARLFITIARIHAFATKNEAESFVRGLKAGFSKRGVSEESGVLRLELVK